MNIIRKIKKWFNGRIFYNEYMNNPSIKLEDLTEAEYNDICTKIDLIIKRYQIPEYIAKYKLDFIKNKKDILKVYHTTFPKRLTEKEIEAYLKGEFIIEDELNIEDYCSKMERRLNYYLKNLSYSEEYFNYFYSYLIFKCRWNGIYPTRTEVKRFLKKEVSTIRDFFIELEEDGKTEEDKLRIWNDK